MTSTTPDPATDAAYEAAEVTVDVFDDTIEDEEFRSLLRRQRAISPTTKALVAILAFVAAFVGGAWAQDNYGTDSGGGASFAFPGGGGLPDGIDLATLPPGAGGGQGLGSGQFGASTSGGTTGTIKLIDNDTVYLEAADGTITKIHFTEATVITVSATGTIDDLRPGDQVTVTGETADDQTVNAERVQQQPSA